MLAVFRNTLSLVELLIPSATTVQPLCKLTRSTQVWINMLHGQALFKSTELCVSFYSISQSFVRYRTRQVELQGNLYKMMNMEK